MLQAIQQRTGGAPVEDPTEPVTADSNRTVKIDLVALGNSTATDEAGLTFAWTCPKCHEVLTAETERKLIGQRGGHTRSKHPKRRRAAR